MPFIIWTFDRWQPSGETMDAMRLTLLLAAIVIVGGLLGCGGSSEGTEAVSTVTIQAEPDLKPIQTPIAKRLKFVAYREVRELAIKTCRAFPQSVLADRFTDSAGGDYDANSIALGYSAKVDISPIRLQEAAYDGCLNGQHRRAHPPN